MQQTHLIFLDAMVTLVTLVIRQEHIFPEISNLDLKAAKKRFVRKNGGDAKRHSLRVQFFHYLYKQNQKISDFLAEVSKILQHSNDFFKK